jgi:16S rRNA (guanine1207-N2)-methyltransferase
MPMNAELLALLRREPDVEAPDLVAVDATDRLLLDTAAELVRGAGPAEVAVVDDSYGALTLGAVGLHGARDVRVHQDALVAEAALRRNAERTGLAGTFRPVPLGPHLADGARVVLVKAPKALDALRETAEVLAAGAAPDVTVLVGGRVKHMTHAMNEVLRDSFTEVSATLARQKSRLLVARGPRPGPGSFPRRQEHPDLGLTVCAHGAAFAGTKIDIGTRALLAVLDRMPRDARTALDLGCGTGVLAAALAGARPGLAVVAVDRSAAAAASATATAAVNGLADRIEVRRDDAAASLPEGSVDLVVCNPPFHLGAAVVTAAADRLFAGAARVLRPGGELWTVYNSALRHRPALQRIIAPPGWSTARRSSRWRSPSGADRISPWEGGEQGAGQEPGEPGRRRTGGCADHGKSIHRSVRRQT